MPTKNLTKILASENLVNLWVLLGSQKELFNVPKENNLRNFRTYQSQEIIQPPVLEVIYPI